MHKTPSQNNVHNSIDKFNYYKVQLPIDHDKSNIKFKLQMCSATGTIIYNTDYLLLFPSYEPTPMTSSTATKSNYQLINNKSNIKFKLQMSDKNTTVS